MKDLKLIFTMLGEASTTDISRIENALGFKENKNTAEYYERVLSATHDQSRAVYGQVSTWLQVMLIV